jgi:hypothetical protein
MTDRELLEKAAKAAGMELLPDGCWPNAANGWFYNEHGGNGGGLFYAGLKIPDSRWNPLTDDGDALRLLVAISLKKGHRLMLPEPGDPWAVVDDYSWGKKARDSDADPCAATRRAIVLAAAALSEAA